MTARYRAPAGDGGLLADPPLDRLGDQLARNAHHLDNSPVRIAGVRLGEFRRNAVEEVLAAARRYLAEGGEPVPPAGHRLLVAGHQPDFFHPGVWVKKFVLHGLAVRHGLVPLNLVVDNDVIKSAAIRVPVAADEPERVRAIPVPFDRPAGDRPHEEYHVSDRHLFDTFPERLREYTRPWGFEPLADQVWPMMAAELDRGATLGTAASRVRRSLERRWGVTNFELPVSRMAETRAFAGFVFTVLADASRFRTAYNAAVSDYRKRNHVRSRNHPAPELEATAASVEVPFWVWRTGFPRRHRLFVRTTESAFVLSAGDEIIGSLPRTPDGFGTAWERVLAEGSKVRPRALSLTLFARLCLGDGFIHGIGGGMYDAVTDDIVRRFFGMEPPGYAVVSATLRLPIGRLRVTADDLHATERRVRDLEWNPQRFEETRTRFPDLVARKAALIPAKPATRADRRRWFRQLQQVTRAMRPAVAGQIADAEASVGRIRHALASDAILGSREYAWPLFPEGMLRDYFTQFR